MLFNSISFMIFFPIVVLLYYLIPHKFRYLWLLGTSYFFYMCWNPSYALLLLFSTFITYLSGILLHNSSRWFESKEKIIIFKKICVGTCLSINLLLLFLFKYFEFMLYNLNLIFEKLNIELVTPTFNLLLPVGISFYIFQALSYTMDVYRNQIQPEKNFLRYALFVSFFPQLVAGPIERSKNLLPQLKEVHHFHFQTVKKGLMMMLWGFFLKMVIADRIALYVTQVYDNYTDFPGVFLIVATILFAFQIYCDFYGYSTIAIGAAKVMGFRLMENFQYPYFAHSVSEFWKYWHISLTSWFKDYLYIPLGGNRKGKLRQYLNIMIVFIVSGLWHGASWTYIIWGALNGIFQIIGDATYKFRQTLFPKLGLNTKSFGHRMVQILVTFCLVDFTWIFFRANSFLDARNIISSMLTVRNPWILFNEGIYSAGLDSKNFTILFFSLCILFVADLCKKKKISISALLEKQDLWFRWTIYLSAIFFILIFGIWGTAYDSTAFIYFQF